MIKHIVFWTLAEEADGRSAAENAVELKRRLESLNGLIPGMVRLEVGFDFSYTDSSADVALYSEFADREALAEYQQHPSHIAVAEFVNLVRLGRFVVDYEV